MQTASSFQNLLYNFNSTEDNPAHGNATNSISLKLQSSLSSECSSASGTNAGSPSGLSNQPQFQQQASDSSKQVNFNTSDDVRKIKLAPFISVCFVCVLGVTSIF